MDTPDFFSGRSPSPRRELQGPRPAPLKVRKESHKIRKAPAAHPQAPPLPVIIYTVSPKIIHANPNDFMSLVQRLTGPNATSPSIERTKSPDVRKTAQADGVEIDSIIRKTGQFPGILSPNPNALPQIHPNLFNISSDNNNYFHDLSPVLYSSRNYSENNLISPNTLDLFHSLFEVQSQEELQGR
ncbi:protein MKS1-like [Salvia hispanica]|uniref:protein MKS1-like n=1 Tax=Salvia hispanica TaxID=49212 RepID=UPI00200946A8|nr:protein MKS1-like [Salvia hispanica]